VRKIQIIVEFGGGPDFADFDATVIRRVVLDRIRLLAVLKIECNILKNTGLVVFDGEVVMRVALLDHTVGNFALVQQCIGGNVFIFNIDGIQQWDGGFDFVGALNLLVGYG
jgi:hypothetical protein